MLASFITHCVGLVDDIVDGSVGRHSMTFQESFDQDSINGNYEWWKWDCTMKVHTNMEDVEDYVGKSCILESWNPRKPSRHVSHLTISNFDAYRHSWKNFNIGTIHYSPCGVGGWHWWGACWKTFHDISTEFWQRFYRWEWRMMITRLHDEHWCKRGRYKKLCGDIKHPWALKPSHTVKACV